MKRPKLLLFALLVTPVLAQPQNQLDNAAVIRLVSEGVPSSAIVETIHLNGRSGFTFTPADLIALGRANVPEEVVNAMMGKSAPEPNAPKAQTKDPFAGTITNLDPVSVPPAPAPAPPAPVPAPTAGVAPPITQPAAIITGPTMNVSRPSVTLPEGTKVRVRLEQELSSATATEGQPVQLSVLEAVQVDGIEVIPVGSSVHGVVVTAVPKRMMGRTGKLDFSITEIVANGRKIPVRYTVVKKNGGSSAVSTGIITAGVAILFWPAAPFVLLHHGKDFTFHQGMPFEVFTDSDTSVALATR